MSALKGKTILVISPQSWGTMFVAKHHYAIELANRGNEVYFLNPPDNTRWHLGNSTSRIKIEASGTPNLFLVWHQLYFPFLFKFHAKGVFDLLIRKQIKDILTCINKPIDIVWSFDLGNLFPFSNFDKAFKIFHPVDEPQNSEALKAATNADIIFSVTKEILERYEKFNLPNHFINHGVADYFFRAADPGVGITSIRVGLSGNLLRPDIDRKILWQIIRENADVTFEFWGAYKMDTANLGGALDEENTCFIQQLKSAPNVVLHGAISSLLLAEVLCQMDAFLICYDIEKDQSKGTNYHKVMEYLSTGKVIISNNITTYQNMPDLVQMVNERTSNKELPGLFKNVIKNIQEHNSHASMQRRISYARDNTYVRQLEKISDIVSKKIDARVHTV